MSTEKIKELATKYQLTKDDFWQLPQNKRLHILTHDACEKIASIEGVRYQKPEWLSKGQDGVWAVEVSGFKKDDPDNVIWTTGEASRQNCTAKYFVNMAEKRGKDRLILKLIRAYEYGIKSEEEADDFKKPSTEKGDILEALREAVVMLDDKQAVFNTADKLFSEGQKSFDANKLKALSADKLELVLDNIKKQIEEINK